MQNRCGLSRSAGKIAFSCRYRLLLTPQLAHARGHSQVRRWWMRVKPNRARYCAEVNLEGTWDQFVFGEQAEKILSVNGERTLADNEPEFQCRSQFAWLSHAELFACRVAFLPVARAGCRAPEFSWLGLVKRSNDFKPNGNAGESGGRRKNGAVDGQLCAMLAQSGEPGSVLAGQNRSRLRVRLRIRTQTHATPTGGRTQTRPLPRISSPIGTTIGRQCEQNDRQWHLKPLKSNHRQVESAVFAFDSTKGQDAVQDGQIGLFSHRGIGVPSERVLSDETERDSDEGSAGEGRAPKVKRVFPYLQWRSDPCANGVPLSLQLSAEIDELRRALQGG